MSISVQQLVQTAFQNCSLIGDGESVDGTMAGTTANDGALGLLNNLLSELNNQQYIVAYIQEDSFTMAGSAPIVGMGESFPNPNSVTLSGNLPDRLLGVSRRIGDRWIPLHSCDRQQMDSRNKMQLATSWSYELVSGDVAGTPRTWGVLRIDSNRPTILKIWYPSKITVSGLSENLSLPDVYFDLLLNGLCVKLCVKYKLTDYLPIFEQQFKQAKNLIKRSNATQRMLQRGDLGGGYNDSYFNGLGGVGW